MIRLLRLIKLDKYIPSISLIDDVIRLKLSSLRVAFFAATTLWVLFAAGVFLFEHDDKDQALDDPVPLYGCDQDCTMSDRFQNYFNSLVYTGIHLTGDYPIITYSWPSRIVNFFMVIAAVGVVSIPSGLIASGFVEIVQSKNKRLRGESSFVGRPGDDWYEVQYRALADMPPPTSKHGPTIDRWQHDVNEFLNGTKGPDGHTRFTTLSYSGRVFIFAVIIANVVAVLAESIPWIDKRIGNERGNFFDAFEAVSVFIFLGEYALRLFSASKCREALYSPVVYATTFFGIVDLLSTAPWFVEQLLLSSGHLNAEGTRIFRVFRVFRLLQLEDFVTAFSKLDNVFRASLDVLRATGLLAMIIWVSCGALFFIFEENNPNWRECNDSIPLRRSTENDPPGCFDFYTTKDCNAYYPDSCTQTAFVNMPDSLYFTAVFLGGEWGVVDFTWPGRFVCLFLCIVGIALCAIPIGTLFDSFGAVLGLAPDDNEDGPGSNEEEE
jgi:Ion transport protein